MITPPTNPRRWLRYSLRTLLVTVTLACIWLGMVVNRAEQQRRTVAALRALNAQVDYDTRYLNPGGPPANWRWLRSWIGDDYFDHVVSVTIPFYATVNTQPVPVDDRLLERIATLSDLKRLSVHGDAITDNGLRTIARLKRLQRLTVMSSRISDAGLMELKVLPELMELDVFCFTTPRYTSDGVAQLQRQLPQLAVEHSAWEPNQGRNPGGTRFFSQPRALP